MRGSGQAKAWCAQVRARLLGAEDSEDRSGLGKKEARAKVAEAVGKAWEEGEEAA